MSLFCRHNRMTANCPICREAEPAPAATRAPRRRATTTGTKKARPASARAAAGLKVRRIERAADDGYESGLVPGVRATADAERLADELAFSAGRLDALAAGEGPGTYAEVADLPDAEEALWLAFLTTYLCPLEGEEPFAAIEQARVEWGSGELPELDLPHGPRTSHESRRGVETLLAYRSWTTRAGTQLATLSGEPSWDPERRFARAFERLTLPGLKRWARYDFLVVAARTGWIDATAGTLGLAQREADPVITAAKRIFGIGDPLLLERRARELADACGLPLDALDLALWNWEADETKHASMGFSAGASDDDARERARGALGIG
jgi:hypothetical protein